MPVFSSNRNRRRDPDAAGDTTGIEFGMQIQLTKNHKKNK